MKAKIVVLIFFFIGKYAHSGNIDSLKTILHNSKNDTTKANLLISISEEYWTINFDSSLKYSTEASVLSSMLSFNKGKANALSSQSSAYYYQGNLDSAISIGTRALSIKIKLGNKKLIGKSYNNIAMFYDETGNYDSAITLYNKALSVFEEIKDKEGTASTYGNMGVMYRYIGNYVIAIDYFLKTLRILENIGNKKGVATTCTNLGVLYANQKEYKESLKYFKNTLQLYEELKDIDGIRKAHQNLGSLFYFTQNLDTALYHFKIAEKMLLETTQAFNLVSLYDNMGSVYKLKKQNKIALSFYLKAMNIADSLGNEYSKASLYCNLGLLHIEMKKYNDAINYCLKEYDLAVKMQNISNISSACNCLYTAYEKKGNLPLAFKFYKEHILYRDSILNENNTKEITQKQMEYSYETQLIADSIKREAIFKMNEYTHKQDIKNQKIYSYAALVGLLIMAVFVFVLYRGNIQKRKNNIQLEEKNKIISYQKLVVEEKHKEITDSINYAERIQRSFLATTEMLDKYLGVTSSSHRHEGVSRSERNYFVFFRPKDVVSGDFYWASKLNNGHFAYCCADSTGHGVPGAIMSILNISSLEKAIETEESPDQILNKTRKIIIERLKNDGSPEGGKDGMDCSLLVLDKKRKKLSFALANNPVFIVRSVASNSPKQEGISRSNTHELIEFKADKMPVGKHEKDQEPFHLHTIPLQPGDTIYTLTDGFSDQFGGSKGKKYMIKNVKELLLQIVHLPMSEQKQKLSEAFNQWKGSNEQVDDVCIIGVRI
ncbi:MAG: tetratricopeptide repeat protein [Vicingaceae bacterium]|nr:MAG: tetratricopeptide repeat protein [Vicingaceae bacterium]